jgi:ribosomal protein S18 acetylase RimI-like enzyme
MIFKIREASPNDVPALAALHVQTFNETHGSYPGSPTYQLRVEQWQKAFEDEYQEWFCLVIETENLELIGFAKGQPYRDSDHSEFAGELNKIYLLKKYQKMGLGKELILIIAKEFMNRGIFSMLLFGDAKNPSNGFYEKMGAHKLFAKNGEFHGGYGWDDLRQIFKSSSQVG